MSDDTPDTDQYFALVDELEHLIESASDEPHFSAREHALMGAGVITRGWLAADRRAVAAKALREVAKALPNGDFVTDPVAWLRNRADRIEADDA